MRPTNATDIITLAFGIATGYLVGLVTIPIAGIPSDSAPWGGVVVAGMLYMLLLGIATATVPTFISWLVGLYVRKMDPIILAGAVAGARNSTTAMRAVSERSQSAIPSFGYPVTYALSTVVFLIYGYLSMVLA